MIPPLQPIRLRSITRWTQDNQKQGPKLPPEALNSLVLEKDEAMLLEFETQEDSLKERLMKSDQWGTEAGLQAFNLGRMEIWQEVVSNFLPTTSDQSTED